MLHASNLNTTRQSATLQSVVQALRGDEIQGILIPDLPKYFKLVASPPNQSLCSTVALRFVW